METLSMKSFLSIFIIALFSITSGYAQDACAKKIEPRIRLVGDSWAHFPAIYQAYDSALAKYGFPDMYTKSSGSALISMTAETWWQFPLTRKALEGAIQDDIGKPIDVVMVSLGGNDVAFGINNGDSLSVLDDNLLEAKYFMDSIFDFIHANLPDAQIIWQGYDYTNFNDPCLDYTWNPYCDMWEDRGYPTPYVLNRFLGYIADYQDSVIRAYQKPYLHYFKMTGLMQWHYGQKTPLRYPPYGTYPPRSVPFPGGNLNYPTPHEAMGLNGIDAYHLGPHSYTVLAEFYVRKFIHNYLRRTRDTTVYSEGKTADGWVRENGETGTGSIEVSNGIGSPTKGIISFNTAFIPDEKVIKKATLFLRTKGIERPDKRLANVFPTNFELSVKQGSFGANVVEAGDYSEMATLVNVGCAAGNLRGNEYGLRFDIDAAAAKYINKTGITQFRLSITDTNAISFFNGDTLEFEGPYLDIYYDTTSIISGIRDVKNARQWLTVFPNPTAEMVQLSFTSDWKFKSTRLRVINTAGVVVWEQKLVDKPIEILPLDVSSWPAGSYTVVIENEETQSSASFVKL